ncbi:MAG: hypothetical protein RAO94_11455 [Candidatus Stygibacter australis]|nr:hypothetical protein [Candidatus Stygibacter australis]MDP8322956.1 hypothetical protein [Candidatus Stygibacter australis]
MVSLKFLQIDILYEGKTGNRDYGHDGQNGHCGRRGQRELRGQRGQGGVIEQRRAKDSV